MKNDEKIHCFLIRTNKQSSFFPFLDELINAIQTDIRIAEDLLELPENIHYKHDQFFHIEKPETDTKNSIFSSNI